MRPTSSVLFLDDSVIDAQKVNVSNTEPALLPLVGDIEVFEDIDFGGNTWRTSLSYSYVGDEWTDRVSSIIIYSGNWQFFEHRDFGGNNWVWGPGRYSRLPFNDVISSWRQVG